jgi:hypothetical protein
MVTPGESSIRWLSIVVGTRDASSIQLNLIVRNPEPGFSTGMVPREGIRGDQRERVFLRASPTRLRVGMVELDRDGGSERTRVIGVIGGFQFPVTPVPAMKPRPR